MATGTTYALVGLGIGLIFQVTGVINFAQGDFVMVSGLMFATLRANGFGTPFAALIAVGVTTVIGALTHLLVIAPVHRAGHHRLMILTIGVSIVLQGAALLVFGADAHFALEFSPGGSSQLLGVAVARQYA
ncbi:hypothetical protein LWC34_01990 [Kibdelosporangium philippinense]|uniref:Branched-chain amino acid ABC transporter permease n=1 Tax=Kibdelosporangium philippinense TaxID=211113 RepID=A0ABS8Z6Z2_9PSEU|nr:hypothetical protein [Kibdelosporangium philippinense]MCE7001617.1 hypothetical protein [Kibdelosporangium philippinense]